MQAANTYTGPTVVSAGLVSLEHARALQSSPLDTTTSVVGDATNGLKTTVTTLTIGGLSGNKNLPDLFTTTSGGYGSVTALTLNPALARSYSGIIADGAFGMSLTKSGAGVQTLSGAHTYSGATAITGGTLKLDGSASIAGSSGITLSSAAGLDVSTLTTPLSLGAGQSLGSSASGANATASLTTALAQDLTLSTGGLIFSAYGGANGGSATNAPLTVTGASAGELKLNGAPVTLTTTTLLASGTYVLVAKGGSAIVTGTPGTLTVNGSGAEGDTSLAVTDDQLVLTVTSVGYDLWKATNAPSTNPDQDEDGDGVTNAVEYVLGGTITTNDLSKLLKAPISGGNMIVSFERDQASIDGTTTVEIEVGTTLAAWTSFPVPGTAVVGPPGVTVVKDSPTTGFDTVTLTVPQAPDPAKFARLKVTITP